MKNKIRPILIPYTALILSVAFTACDRARNMNGNDARESQQPGAAPSPGASSNPFSHEGSQSGQAPGTAGGTSGETSSGASGGAAGR